MDLKLRDKLAMVSGSTAGIGYAIAAALAAEGARVIVNGRTEAAVADAAARIGAETGRDRPGIRRRPRHRRRRRGAGPPPSRASRSW